MQLLVPEMQLEGQKNEMKRQEAWQVYGALLVSLYSYICCSHLFPYKLLEGTDTLTKFPVCGWQMYA